MKKWSLFTKMFALCLAFCAVAMAGMIAFFALRDEPANASELAVNGMIMEENGLLNDGEQEENTEYICIPLPAEMTEDRIEIINDLSGHKVMVMLQNIPEDFFYRYALSGNNQYVVRQMYGYMDGMARLDFELSDLCEYEQKTEADNLYLKFLRPEEKFPYIVALDAGHGGEDAGTVVYGIQEKDVALNTVLRVGERLEEEGIQVYYTRKDDRTVGTEERVHFAKEVQADLFVSIHCNADARTRVTKGIEVLTKRPHRDLADYMTKELGDLSDSVNESIVNGIPVLDGLDVPAVMIQTGYLTNKQEALRLADEKYLDKIADSIYNGIMQIYEGAEKQ